MTLLSRAITSAALAGLWMITGCAQATQGAAGAARGSGAQLNREQLAEVNSDNLYDAIAKLRPEWLTSRGPTSVTNGTPSVVDVYMNGTMLGKADYLREVRLLDVTEVRYWDAGQASARFGMGHPRGVIEITRK
jgi:hypothetical protein